MFEIILKNGHFLSTDEKIFEVTEYIIDTVYELDFMSEYDVTEIFCVDSSNSSKSKGWTFRDIGGRNKITYHRMKNGDLCVTLPDSKPKRSKYKSSIEDSDPYIPTVEKETLYIPDVFDPIKMPNHYVDGRKYEPWKVVADWGLDFCLGNAIKYISRAGRKGGDIKKAEDLKKAIQYLEFELSYLKGNY